MKSFTVSCQAGGRPGRVRVHVGRPAPGFDPLHFQAAWLAEERGVHIPDRVLQGFADLLELSRQSGESFEELCVEAMRATEAAGEG
jgi:hypothetical protein